VPAEDLYQSHREVIERALASVCRRQRLNPADAEDFSAGFRLRLVEDDYRVIRAFSGRSSLLTYLLAVITHHYQDWRNARWGKWRPSAEARRLGPVAVRLETMLVRDRLSLDEAYESLRSRGDLQESRQAIETMAARFPHRQGRVFVSDEELATAAAEGAPADAFIEADAGARAARAATTALRTTIAAMPPEDRLILRMRYEDNATVAEIARALGTDQKPLYRRVERLLADLRTALERAGVTAETAVAALGTHGFDAVEASSSPWGESAGEVRPLTTGSGVPLREESMKR
jgi:RNA polymerase sigma factor for flagellar operon FliA